MVGRQSADDRSNVLGIPIDALTMRQTVEQLLAWITQGQSRHVVTVNPEFIMLARRNMTFRHVLRNADLVVPDGIGTVVAARILGRALPERVGGVDLVEQLAVAAPPGTRLFLLGARPGVARKAAAVLSARNSGLRVSGVFAGSPCLEHEDEIARRIIAARPDVLLVAFGAPAQEFWIARNREHLRVPVCIGVGGAFDFISGRTARAPRLLRRAGLEWAHRLMREPWRWRRMLALPQFALLVLLERARFAVSARRWKRADTKS